MSPDMPTQGTPNRAPKAVLWIVLVVLVAGVIGLSYYVYQQDNGNSNTNAVENANATINSNENSSGNLNTNTGVNLNANANSTTNINSPANVNAQSLRDYSSSDGMFGLKYPNDWSLVALGSTAAGVALRSPNFTPLDFGGSVQSKGDIYIATISNPKDLSILELIDTFSDTSRFWPQRHSYSVVNIDGLSSIQFAAFQDQGESFSRSVTFIPLRGQTVSISYYFVNPDHQDVYSDILSSFTRTQ